MPEQLDLFAPPPRSAVRRRLDGQPACTPGGAYMCPGSYGFFLWGDFPLNRIFCSVCEQPKLPWDSQIFIA